MIRSLEAAFVLASRLSPSRISSISSSIASGASSNRVLQTVSSTEAREALEGFLEAVHGEALSAEVAAAVLLSSSHTTRAKSEEQGVELVVTGPGTPFVATRRTEQVLLDLIRAAETDLFMVSFVTRDWSQIIDALAKARIRGVRIRVLLEASAEDGGTLERDQSQDLVRLLPDVEIYRWSNKAPEFEGGRVHAKIALADDRLAFLTSANFTGHAMEKNLEAGTLVRGGDLPRDLARHLQGLIDLRVITLAGS